MRMMPRAAPCVCVCTCIDNTVRTHYLWYMWALHTRMGHADGPRGAGVRAQEGLWFNRT